MHTLLRDRSNADELKSNRIVSKEFLIAFLSEKNMEFLEFPHWVLPRG